MEPLHAHSPVEAEYYLKVTPCPRCGKGPWSVQPQGDEQDARTMLVRCVSCDLASRFEFFCEPTGDGDAMAAYAGDELVNPSSEPSRIIDVGQWISLFYFLIDSAGKSAEKAQTRKVAFQAAQCLEEAMKFYGRHDSLPPPSAFYVESSREAMTRFPERFECSRLRDLRSKLPDFHVMARRLAQDVIGTPPPKKAKWKFWKK